MTTTRKPPKGAKHDRCITHVAHDYPKAGWLCITTADPSSPYAPAAMTEFADHLARVAMAHRSAELDRQAIPAAVGPGALSDHHARGTTHLPYRSTCAHTPACGPIASRQPAPDTYAAAIAAVQPEPVKVPRKARAKRPSPMAAAIGALAERTAERGTPLIVSEPVQPAPAALYPEPVQPDPAPVLDALSLCNACDVNAADPESPAGYCADCEREARAQTEPDPDPTPVGPCDYYLHTVGVQPIRCNAGPIGHEPTDHQGGHNYPRAAAPDPLTWHCVACDRDYPAPIVSHALYHVTEPAAQPEPVSIAPEPAAPVLAALPPVLADGRPTCPRCGQVFRKHGTGYAWHVANRPDCAAGAVRPSIAS